MLCCVLKEKKSEGFGWGFFRFFFSSRAHPSIGERERLGDLVHARAKLRASLSLSVCACVSRRTWAKLSARTTACRGTLAPSAPRFAAGFWGMVCLSSSYFLLLCARELSKARSGVRRRL